MNASSSTVNLFPEKLQSGLSVSDLRALEISNPSRQPPNRYDSSVVNKNSKEGYYFFDVLKPPSLQNQQESLAARNSVKPPAINNPDKHDSQTQNQNAQLREEIQLLHEDYRVEVAKYEEEIRDLKRQFSLHAQNTDTKSADIEKKVLTIESRAKVAEAENLQLKSKLTEIKARNEQYEDTVRNMTRKMEKALRSNRLLLERGTELDEALTETQKRWLETKKEYENLSRWVVAHKESLSDYEAAMDVSNAFSNFPAGISKEFPQGSNVLSHHVKALIDSKKDLQLRVTELSKQVNEVQNKYDNATEKYMNDLEKKNAQIAVLKSKDEIAIEMIATLKAEIDKHQRENLKVSLQCSRLEEEMRSVMTKTDSEMSELQSRATSQLRTIREQFDSDRLSLRMTVDKITKEKVDLQAEVGQLLRDRRTAVSEMYQRDPRLDKFY